MWALLAVCLLGSKRRIRDFQILCTWVELWALDLGSVVTFWEGEVVDAKNYAFFTNKWKATYRQVEVDGGKSLDLSNYQYIFMVIFAYSSFAYLLSVQCISS
ncbi:hypothetical protein Hanom_Chr10g00885281 [Helianthus anomalus]